MGDRFVGDLEVGVGGDLMDEIDHLVSGYEGELKVLGSTADCRHDLVGFGRGEHKDDVIRGFLEGLQQCVLRPGGEHVDLIEEVHLAPPRVS